MPTAPIPHNFEQTQQRKRDYEKQRSDEKSFYWSTRWRKFRRAFLASHPLCWWCKQRGIVKQATEIDHIKPRIEWPELSVDADNCRPGCKSCHAKYGAKRG
jgi:5-methylcytosine-specific restriction protein A